MQSGSLGHRGGGWMNCWKSSSGANRGRRSRKRWTWKTRALPRLPVEEDRLRTGVSKKNLYYYYFLLMVFLGKDNRSARPVPLPNSGAQQRGGDTVKVSWKNTEDMKEGSSSRKKQKRKEDEEAA